MVRASVIEATVCAAVLSPVMFALSTATQEKVEPVMLALRARFTLSPLQMEAVAVLFITGAGFTVTVSVCTVPVQPLKVGVMV